MTTTLGTIGDYDMVDLARHLAPRQQIAILVLEADDGWHSYGYHSGELVWQSEPGPSDNSRLYTVFAVAGGKFAFQRSSASAPDGVRNALSLVQSSRSAVYRTLQGG